MNLKAPRPAAAPLVQLLHPGDGAHQADLPGGEVHHPQPGPETNQGFHHQPHRAAPVRLQGLCQDQRCGLHEDALPEKHAGDLFTTRIMQPSGGLDFSLCLIQDQNFELLVLEAALDHVVRKFGRHLQIIKPSVEMILQQIEANPETNGLKRLLAVKKSFAEFEQKVEHYAKILRSILADDEDMMR